MVEFVCFWPLLSVLGLTFARTVRGGLITVRSGVKNARPNDEKQTMVVKFNLYSTFMHAKCPGILVSGEFGEGADGGGRIPVL